MTNNKKINCKRCKVLIHNRGKNSLYCLKCAEITRQETQDLLNKKKKSKPVKVDIGVKANVCEYCNKPVLNKNKQPSAQTIHHNCEFNEYFKRLKAGWL